MPRKKRLDLAMIQWGWITPGTNDYLRLEQRDKHLEFLARPVTPASRHLLLMHCGWWLDADARPAVRNLTGRNPEPHRHLVPCDKKALAKLRGYIQKGRMEFVVYPYAACVAEATTGEGLLRSLRLSRELAEKAFGKRVRAVCNHDATYNLDWTAVQMPQIAQLLGFEALVATHNGHVRALDGTRVRLVGPDAAHAAAVYYADDLSRPYLMCHELHGHLEFMARLAKGAGRLLPGTDWELRAITLDELLRRVPPKLWFDARHLGTKNWYGGTIDSLLQEQNAKRVELRLPAVEALAVLSGSPKLAKTSADLVDLWKKSFILMDNHTLWQCHNYKAHYLPESRRLLDDTLQLEAGLLGSGKGRNVVVFNPTPWRRDIVAPDGNKTFVARNVPGWGARVLARSEASEPKKDRRTLVLENERVRYKLNRLGEVVESRTRRGVEKFKGLGRLLRIHEHASREVFTLKTGQERTGIEGGLRATAEVEIPSPYITEASFAMDDVAAAAFLMQVERLDRGGKLLESTWHPLHSLHWGGGGMPRRRLCIAPCTFQAHGARRLRITLWMLAEGSVSLGPARVWLRGRGDERAEISQWRGEMLYRNAYSAPSNVKARVIRSDEALKMVRFSGTLPDARYAMDVSLRAGSDALEYALKLRFPKPTRLGLLSPPFTEQDGSMLGAECERPYVPGICVLFPLPDKARYFSDKPFYLRQALTPAERTWHTDRERWWLGMSTFIGMNLAAADYRAGQLGLLTQGIKHFFRWQRGGEEMLGLSLGASVIHQMTQGHSVLPDSPVYELAKRTSHNPYFETPFLRAHGEYVFHYAICPSASGAAARARLWKASREFALPAQALRTDAPPGPAVQGVSCTPSSVIITALEPRGDGLALRVVNRSSRKSRARIRLPMPVRLPKTGARGLRASMNKGVIHVDLPPWAVREIPLDRG